MQYITFSALQEDLQSGRLHLKTLANHYLQRISDFGELNAFIEVFDDETIERASLIQQKINEGKAGKLAGMIIGIKDNICYAGHKVSAGSKILSNYTSVYSSTVVERLIAEDAIIIGRLNCDEFGMGASNENSIFGPVRNFADQTRVSGGSSGGSAVAVQAGLCHAALGTDTGGSVRQPASFCGVIGFKPSYGRISRHGIIAYASSFDQVGTITRSVEDAALLLEVLAGKDRFDSTVSQREVPSYTRELTLSGGKKVAVLAEAVNSKGLDPEIRTAFDRTVKQLKSDGHQVEELHFEYLDYLVPTYYILTMAEASSNLSRYDGIHYGYRSADSVDLQTTYSLSRGEGFGKEVKRRILMGTFVLSAGFYDAYYAKAQKVRRLIAERTKSILDKYDVILVPAAPTPAYPIGHTVTDPVVKYLGDIYTVQASLSGLPAISVPVGDNSEGLPIGLQFIGRPFGEADLLAFSKRVLEIIRT